MFEDLVNNLGITKDEKEAFKKVFDRLMDKTFESIKNDINEFLDVLLEDDKDV